MKLKICPTCSCSLVRLGIKSSDDLTINYQRKTYFFCCIGCLELFKENAEQFIEEIKDLVICPVCLAEKQKSQAVSITYDEESLFFCRCPYCLDEFNKKPQYYVDRLNGKTEYAGLFNNICCGHDSTNESTNLDVELKSTITCPNCEYAKAEDMPTNACQFFYECENCKKVLKPKEGDCCVYCSYGTVPCPPIQKNKSCC